MHSSTRPNENQLLPSTQMFGKMNEMLKKVDSTAVESGLTKLTQSVGNEQVTTAVTSVHTTVKTQLAEEDSTGSKAVRTASEKLTEMNQHEASETLGLASGLFRAKKE